MGVDRLGHIEAMNSKIERLLELDAVEVMEQRWDEDYAERYNDSRLALDHPTELSGDYPGDLAALFALTNRPRFGSVEIRSESNFRETKVVDSLGEPIDDRARIRIGDVGEDAILLDKASGAVMIYNYTYFKWGWSTGTVLECADVPEFVDTVALGPRYREILGPLARVKAWWREDPWFEFLVEIGMADQPF